MQNTTYKLYLPPIKNGRELRSTLEYDEFEWIEDTASKMQMKNSQMLRFCVRFVQTMLTNPKMTVKDERMLNE